MLYRFLSTNTARPSRLFLLPLLGGAFAAGCKTPAEEPASPEPQAPAIEEEREPDSADEFHALWSERVLESAKWLDSVLGDERALAEDETSSANIRLISFIEERKGLDVDAKVKARLVLPRSERRLQLVMAGDDEEQGDNSPVEQFEDPANLEDTTGGVGMQYFLRNTERNNFRVEAGLRLKDFEPNVYVGLRLRHIVLFDPWSMRLRENVRRYTIEGVESHTTVDLERLVSENQFFRSTTGGSWYEERVGFYYFQQFALHHFLNKNALVSGEWSNSFSTRPNNVLDETVLRVSYTRLLERKWVSVEIAPQVAFRRAIDYQPAWGLTLRMEFFFGGARVQDDWRD